MCHHCGLQVFPVNSHAGKCAGLWDVEGLKQIAACQAATAAIYSCCAMPGYATSQLCASVMCMTARTQAEVHEASWCFIHGCSTITRMFFQLLQAVLHVFVCEITHLQVSARFHTAQADSAILML